MNKAGEAKPWTSTQTDEETTVTVQLDIPEGQDSEH